MPNKGPHPKTVALANRYHHQVQDLLALMADNGVKFKTPAQILTGICKVIGWRLEFPQLPPGRWAECDRDARAIRVTKDLRDRLDYPERARQVAHESIAHEIGHALLHSGPRKSRLVPKAWEWEAKTWAKVLLCPWHLLADRPEIQQLATNALTIRQRWETVSRLAEEFGVTVSFMKKALVLHGIIEVLDDGAIQAPAGLIVSMARRSRQAG